MSSHDSAKTLDLMHPAKAMAAKPPHEEFDRFRLERQLGQGGMGQVWEAWDPKLERRVAIKRLLTADLSARQRFLREARLQATITHPGICPVFEVGEHQGEPYLVMPCLDGTTLDQAVDGAALEYTLELMRQIAEAVHAAHQQGLIHRDLKPSNILVENPPDAAPRPMVLDFGIARPLESEGLTASGEILGTPAYMAPEQVKGQISQLDRRADVYALGATLYRLLTGRPPHTGEGTPLLLRIIHDEPERLLIAEVPVEVEAIVFKCLEKDKSRRYESAKALAEDLRRFLTGEPVLARPVTRWVRLGKWLRRHRVVVRATAAAALLAVAGLAWGGWSTWRSEERREAARRFGAQVEEIEALARYSHLVPQHDVRADRTQLRARLAAIRPSLDDRDAVVRSLAAHALGRGHLALDELETAREYLETANDLDPDNPEIAADLGRALSELYRDRLTDSERFGDPAKRSELGKELAHRISAELAGIEQVQEHSQLSLGAPALEMLRRGRAYWTESSAELEALVLFHNGQPEAALDLLSNAPPVPSWRYERWRLEGDIRRSWAVSLYHEGTETTIGAARQQLEAARDAYQRALAVAPSNAALMLDDAQTISLLVLLEIVSLEEGEPLIREARQRLNDARSVDPEALDVWLWSVRIELVAAEHASNLARDPRLHLENALSYGNLAREAGESSSALWYAMGRAHERLARQLHLEGKDPTDRYQLAAKAFDRVAPQDRDYAFYTSLGLLRLAIAGNRKERGLKADDVYASALDAYRSAAELNSSPFAALFNLGVTLFDSADLDEANRMTTLQRAVEIFGEARRLRPQSMYPNYYLGLTRQRLSQEVTRDFRLRDPVLIEQATKDLQRAVELAPDRFEPRIGLAAAMRRQAFDAFLRGQELSTLLASTREAHEQALKLAPDHPIALHNAGQVEYLAGWLALRQGLNPTTTALKSESLCRRSLAARYRANALYCVGEALSIQAEFRLGRGELDEARVLISQVRELLEEALVEDSDHLGTLQSLSSVLILESRRLRQIGQDPTQVLKEAGRLIEHSFTIDDFEISPRLVEASWYQEQALWFRTEGLDSEQLISAGLHSTSLVLAKVPSSPEARRIKNSLQDLRGE